MGMSAKGPAACGWKSTCTGASLRMVLRISSASLTGENCEEWNSTVPPAAGGADVAPDALVAPGTLVAPGAGVALPPQAASSSAAINRPAINNCRLCISPPLRTLLMDTHDG